MIRRAVLACAFVACGPRQGGIDVPPPTSAVAREVDAGPPPAPRGTPIDLVVGAGAAGLGAGQPIRVAFDVGAVRARPDGAEIGAAVRALPVAATFRDMTDVDPYADGEWLVFYGASFFSPEKSVLVLRHTKENPHPRDPNAKVLGDVVIAPQAHVVAIVPEARKAAIGAELARPLVTGLRAGELMRLHLDDAASFVPGITKLDVLVRAADDGGLDVGADGACADPCEKTALDLRALVKRLNGAFVRMAMRGVLDPLETDAIRVHDAHIEARLHATPEQVRAVVNVAGASLGARAP